MYVPKHFEGAESDAREIMAAHSWALLTTTDADGAPLTTHLSLLWRAEGGPQGSLIGHMARANPHWRLFACGTPSLALFWGPHAYVSPTWYTPGAKVPTWNYVTVHAWGRVEIVNETAGALAILADLARAYEGEAGWTLGALPPGNAEAQTRGIVALRMPIERLETKLKLSQNRDASDRAQVAAKLEASADQDARATARWMRRTGS